MVYIRRAGRDFKARGSLLVNEPRIVPRVVDTGRRNPEALARSLNVLRTHYLPSQRATFTAERATLPHSVRPASRSHITKLGDVQPLTIEEAAREAGVAPSMVIAAKRILRNDAPDIWEHRPLRLARTPGSCLVGVRALGRDGRRHPRDRSLRLNAARAAARPSLATKRLHSGVQRPSNPE